MTTLEQQSTTKRQKERRKAEKATIAEQDTGAAQAAFTFVTGGASTALKLFRVALISTGVGALVVAVGLLVANFDKLLVPIQAAGQALKDFGDAIGLTSFAEADAAFNGIYKVELDSLTGLSKEDIDSITPGTEDLRVYSVLIKVVEKASKENTSKAQLIGDIKELGDIAVKIAKKIPQFSSLL